MKKKYNDKITIRIHVLTILIITVMLFLLGYLFYIQIINQEKYKTLLDESMITTYYGSTAPRGRIYDRNGNILVDNEPIKVIYYKKEKITTKEEIALAYKVSKNINLNIKKLTERMIKDFLISKSETSYKEKIKEEEWKDLELRKITLKEIEDLKRKRITKEEIDALTEEDKKAAYLYYLMNKGYSYLEKIIKGNDVTDEEYAYIAANITSLKGFNVRLDWKRTYPNGNTFKSIFGIVSNIPNDKKNEYLKNGYSLEDRVGVSYLEYEYDKYLKGKKDTYLKEKDKDILLKEGNRGNDIYLSIDINLQKKVEEILEEELEKAKKEKNTKYYNKSFVVINNPKTGEILAMSGKMIEKKENSTIFYDYTPGIFTTPVTVGSVIKGASHIVGYNTGALKIGEKRNDSCVKLAATPLKCSWKSLGNLNDITALKYSSNTYQFYTAMKVANYKYIYNGVFPLDQNAFKTYRETFNQFGLGILTGLDVPNEGKGLKGTNDTAGLLLDFSIGQYDTYTPMQILQYIGTIANNGIRVAPHLLNYVVSSTTNEKIYINDTKELNKINTEEKYIKRVQEGFKEVLKIGGTGYNYVDLKYKPAGKTGTSQSFIDSDSDGKIDKETLTHTFAAYAPYDDPKVAFVVISPDVYYEESGIYTTSVNKRITKKISDAYFELYS